MAVLDSNNNARFKGYSGTATKNTTTDLDFLIPDNRIILGARMIVSNHVLGDKFTTQVIDIDNVIGHGANTVISEYVTDWYVDHGSTNQGDVIVPEKLAGAIPNGTYIRFKYTSIGTVFDVSVKVNFYLYEFI